MRLFMVPPPAGLFWTQRIGCVHTARITQWIYYCGNKGEQRTIRCRVAIGSAETREPKVAPGSASRQCFKLWAESQCDCDSESTRCRRACAFARRWVLLPQQ